MAERKLCVTDHMGLCRSIARRYSRICTHLTFDDLLQESVIGLTRALELFEPSRGFAFSTFASHWIRQACTRAIANRERTVRIPVWRLAHNSKHGISSHERVVSTDAALDDDEPGRTLLDVLMADASEDPEQTADAAARWAALRAAIAQLPDRQRDVISQRLRGRTLREIGEGWGLSRERARQLEAEATEALRRCVARPTRAA